MGIGITATTISVGVIYSSGDDAANNSLGNNITTGDQQADAQAVIDDINARGGVAGRKLVPVWYDVQETDARPYAAIDAEACAKFTQDNHVFAIAGDGLTDNLAACATHAGVFMANSVGQLIGPDNAYFRKYRYVYQLAYVSQDRMMAEEAKSLVRQNYFSGWNANTGNPANGAKAKLGIMSYDTPNWSDPLHHVLLPALAHAGYQVDPADVQEVAYPAQTNDVGSTVAQIQGAVLRFRQDGVSHVIVLDANGSMTLHMLNNMRAQHYYPRLGVNSATGVETLATQYHEDSQSFNGAVGLSWLPLLDLPAGVGGKYFTPRTSACIKMVERRTGQNFPDTNSASVALGYCDELNLIADGINRAGSVVNRDTATSAIDALGDTFAAAGSHGLYFSPTRHDGIEYGYDMTFDVSCTCTKYARGPFRIP
jgi:ABC-type branched-subunit amino acid transport system substrate-binding protein